MELVKKILKNPYEELNKLLLEDLEILIKFANDKYRNTDKPVISDDIYDIAIDFLKIKNPKSKILKEIGCKVKSKNKVTLDYWLGSMNKIKSTNLKELLKWKEKYKNPYYISSKLDGISAMLIYRKNNIINLYTRGTANEGLDISPLLKYIKGVPSYESILKIKASKPNILLAVRGELIIKKNIFINNWSSKFKNPRNTVSGLVNSKTINPLLANDTSFIAYEIIDPINKFSTQMKLLEELNFECVYYKELNDLNFEILSKTLVNTKNHSEYEIDGLIITNDEKHIRNIKSNPDYAFAFKDILEEQKAHTKIIKIEWNQSKDGYIKPTLIIEPVKIGGVEINRVTGNNAKFIVDNKLGPNAEVEIIRSGDVIPKIEKIIKPGINIILPTGKWHWNKTNVDIISDDLNTNEIIIKNIAYFFSSLGAKGIGEKIIEKLVNNNYDNIIKIIKLTVDDLLKIEGFKEKSSNNFVTTIKKSLTNITLVKLMSASNKLGHGIGEERVKQILDFYPNILNDYKKWTKEEFINKLIEINGWDEINSSLFVNNFNNFKIFYDSIKPYITFINNKKINKNKYTDKIIVFSGFRDTELQKKLEDSGAKISNIITKNTNFLIVKDKKTLDSNTGKIIKAKEFNINIITKDTVFLL
jgi:NAD-dependent DNA ligase